MSVQDNFTIDAGGTLIREFAYLNDEGNPIDISGYTARAQVRKSTFGNLSRPGRVTFGRVKLGREMRGNEVMASA